MNTEYNVKALLDMAQEYLTAENEYRIFLLTWKGGWVPSMDPEKYGEYVRRDVTSSTTYDALRSACEVVSADLGAVIATAKAMNRYERRELWQVCAHIGYHDEDPLRRFLSEPNEWETKYYRSTGRPIPWAA